MKSLLCLWLLCALSLPAAELPPFTAGKSTVSFTDLPKQAEPDEVKWRLHSVENPGAFDLAKDKFQLIIPATYKHADKWGVFIWISPGDTAGIPADWERGARRAGSFGHGGAGGVVQGQTEFAPSGLA